MWLDLSPDNPACSNPQYSQLKNDPVTLALCNFPLFPMHRDQIHSMAS